LVAAARLEASQLVLLVGQKLEREGCVDLLDGVDADALGEARDHPLDDARHQARIAMIELAPGVGVAREQTLQQLGFRPTARRTSRRRNRDWPEVIELFERGRLD